ncbi:SHOCT domain-containing protein [Trebonia kvetii]|uniref:SHOCT domain-containing protein n=1 Tax=Trebonia kvetii TaxID=2480626 RepID=A0A6P2BKM4_9ACTN|nr:SHOCT domain-containing protein [Trebonia kvetii]TVY98964.1 SHOCT domain-containing protein [Trebonia kvetii]
MPLAASTDYPVLNVFWTIFEIFAFVLWFWLLFVILTDVFRSSDLSGWGKAGWTIFVIFLPVIGILTYLIVRGPSMHERSAQQARQQDEALRSYVQEAAGSTPSSADQLAKLADLRQRGVITSDEFEQQKTKVLSSQ